MAVLGSGQLVHFVVKIATNAAAYTQVGTDIKQVMEPY
jgi:hypothetical protein